MTSVDVVEATSRGVLGSDGLLDPEPKKMIHARQAWEDDRMFSGTRWDLRKTLDWTSGQKSLMHDMETLVLPVAEVVVSLSPVSSPALSRP